MPSYDKQGNLIISREEQLEQQLAQMQAQEKPKNLMDHINDVGSTVAKYALGAGALAGGAYLASRPGVRQAAGNLYDRAVEFGARQYAKGGDAPSPNAVDVTGTGARRDFYNQSRSERPQGVQMGSLPPANLSGPGNLPPDPPPTPTEPPKSPQGGGGAPSAAPEPEYGKIFHPPGLRQLPPGRSEPSRQQKVSDFLDTAKSQLADAQPTVDKAVETADRIAPAQDDTAINEAAEYAKGMMDKGFGRSQSRRQVAGRMQEAAEDNINKTGESVLKAFLSEEGYTVQDQSTQAQDVDGYQEVKPHRQAAQRQGADLAQIDNAAKTDLGTPNPRAADNDWENRGSMDPVEKFDNPNPITDGETSTQPQKPSMATELRSAIAASNEADRQLGRLVGNYIDEQSKDLGRMREAIDPGVKASDDAVMRKAMMVSPSKMAASAVEDNRPDNVDRMMAATKPENMDTMGRMESAPSVFVKGKALVEGPGTAGSLYEGKTAYGDYIRDIHHNIDSELEELTGVPTADRPKSASAVRSAASREKREPIMYKGVLEGGSYNPSEAAARPVTPTQAVAEVANTPGASQSDVEETARQVGNTLINQTKKRRAGYGYGTSMSDM